MSSADFRQAHPFLWLSIMACSSCSVRQANVLGDKLRHMIATKVIQEVERSLDLLQGMMVFLQWPHCHTSDKPWMSFWTNLAVAIAQDLGFTTLTGETAFTYIKKFWLPKNPCRQPQANSTRTMEERRIILALYVWTTTYAQMVRRDNPLPWTPFMEQSLRALMNQPEWEGDSILAAQVRSSLVGLQITDLSIQQALRGEVRIPLFFHQSLSSQMEEIWRTLPSNLLNNETVLIHLHATEVAVHEIGLSVEPSINNMDTIKRLNALRSCLNALENFFQAWDRITPSQYMGLTFNMFVHLLNCIVALFRLSTLDNIPGWDPTEARSRLPLFTMLDHIAEQMDATTSAIPIINDESPNEDVARATVWAKAGRVMRLIKQGIKRDFPDLDPLGSIESVAAMSTGSTGIQVPPPDVQDPFFANFADDPWLSAIFVPWDSMNF
ncbi:hypothetical protein BD289DRAFT_484233 [Coniella lustricola]|uniref:Transcription factor domain-containing protein n=1 Tax=Coniella lustricola TaxID=2025994 RepID=A0A2T3A2P8_9PEZI|nr:hypothetical protein BD289DRAFT_484233 [Coniella lustricola]